MGKLLLSDLKLVLDDLFTKRKKALLASSVGKVYAPQLEVSWKKIGALPTKTTAAVAPDDALRATDLLHDAFGRAIYYVTEAYAEVPSASAEVKAASARVRAFFIPELRELRDDYVIEADRATKRKKSIADIAKDLKSIPVAGGTLYDWAKEFLANGIKLSEILAERAGTTPKKTEKGTGLVSANLRSSTEGLLRRYRAALKDEAASNKKLAGNDAAVFGYFDQLSEHRAQVGKQRKTKAKAKPAPTNPTPAGG